MISFPSGANIYYAGRAAGLAFALRLLATLDEPVRRGELLSIRTMHGTVRAALAGAHDADLAAAGAAVDPGAAGEAGGVR